MPPHHPYMTNETLPFSVHDNVDHPISLYVDKEIKNSWHILILICMICQQVDHDSLLFMVHGDLTWPCLCSLNLYLNKPINVFNHGDMSRDFTFIDDIVSGIIKVADKIPTKNEEWSGFNPDPSSSMAPWKIYNIGNSSPVQLMNFIKAIEKATQKEAILNKMPMQPGDVPSTFADVKSLEEDVGYKSKTKVNEGIKIFVDWYRRHLNNYILPMFKITFLRVITRLPLYTCPKS